MGVEPGSWGLSGPPGDFHVRSGSGGPALGSYVTELLCKMKPLAVEVSEQGGVMGIQGEDAEWDGPGAEGGQHQPSRWA